MKAPARVVVIADDEEPITRVLAMIVAEAGYTPVCAAHGREALELVRKHRPALLITDWMMPYVDGAELLAQLRAEQAASGQKGPSIIVMTAGSPMNAKDVGADATLRKPFELAEVETLLQRFIGGP